jgi:hypothetical protein
VLKIPNFSTLRHVRGCGMLQGWDFCALSAKTSITKLAGRT